MTELSAISDFLYYKNWFSIKYAELGLRLPSLKMSLNLMLQNNGKVIVETGTAKEWDDVGAGRSTDALSVFAAKYDIDFYTVDIFSGQLRKKSEDRILKNGGKVTFVESDSVEFLQNFDKTIDFLYLDSYDFPAAAVAKAYAPDFNHGWKLANEAEFNDVIEKCGSIIAPCQEHCLKELQAAYEKLTPGAPILIDDSSLAGGGKSRMAKEWLLERSHKCIYDEYQSLWVK